MKKINILLFHRLKNLKSTVRIFNKSPFHRNFTKILSIKSDHQNETNIRIHLDKQKIQSEQIPITVETHE